MQRSPHLEQRENYSSLKMLLIPNLVASCHATTAVWAFITILSAFTPRSSLSSPPDWFLCVLCHPAADKWCCLLHRQNGQYLIHFQFWAPAIVCVTGCFVGAFARKLTPAPANCAADWVITASGCADFKNNLVRMFSRYSCGTRAATCVQHRGVQLDSWDCVGVALE